MGRYRKIDPRIWNDECFRELSQSEMLIVFYMITAQSNRIGLFNFSLGKASEDLGIRAETLSKGLIKVCDTLKWGWDKQSRTFYISTWWKYNHPENPNVMRGCLKDLHELPQTPLYQEFYNNTKYINETFIETFKKGLLEPLPIQEQEPEQEPEQEQDLLSGTETLFYEHFDEYVLNVVGRYMINPKKQRKALRSILDNRKSPSGKLITSDDLDVILDFILKSKDNDGFKWYGNMLSLTSLSQKTSKGDQWKVELILRQSQQQHSLSRQQSIVPLSDQKPSAIRNRS